MIARVMQDERARTAARRMRAVYRIASVVWVAAMAAFGAWLAISGLG